MTAPRDIATGDQAEGEYAIFDGTHFNGGCCFDYGNAETSNDDTGAGHMEAIYFGNIKVWGYGTGNGPWIMADMENGLFSGSELQATTRTTRPSTSTSPPPMIKGNRATSGPSGAATRSPAACPPSTAERARSGYNPMHKEGAIILGIGGDNSKGSAGTFYEGVMTSGYPVGRHRERGPGQHRRGRLRALLRAAAGRPGRSSPASTAPSAWTTTTAAAPNGNKVQMWDCDGNAAAQNWTVNSNGTLTIDGGCMDITGANYNNGTLVELWTCNGGCQPAMAGGQRATGQPGVRQMPRRPELQYHQRDTARSCGPATAAPTSNGICHSGQLNPGWPAMVRGAAAGHPRPAVNET